MERPALKRLLADIETGQIDVIAAWLEEFTAELLAFPGRHDDQVDALTQGLAWGRYMAGRKLVVVPLGPY